MNELFLHENLMLLALRDKTGKIASGTWYSQAVAGALLAELLLRKRIALGPEKQDTVQIVDSKPVGDDLLDACLQIIESDSKPRSLPHWLSKASGITDLRHRAVAGLVARGTLRADRDKILWIFTRRVYPEIDPQPESALIEHLRGAIFGESVDLDGHTIVLIAIAHHTGLLELTFDAKELEPRKEHIERIISGNPTGEALSNVIQAVNAALMVAVSLPAITATTIV